ncbi:MAG: cell wall hydrolase [Rhodospirillales bacterium]
MRRETKVLTIGVAVGFCLWLAALLIPGQLAAMPLGGLDEPPSWSAPDEGVPTALTQLPPAMRDRLSNIGPDLRQEFRCLALNVFWESKGEPLVGQIAVASVTLNRLANPRFPKTICEVVWQGFGLGRSKCQFSWVCDRRLNEPNDEASWERAQQVAYRTMFLDPVDPTDGAMYFHATYVRPDWSYEKPRIMRIGRHIFYGEVRSSAQLSGISSPRS